MSRARMRLYYPWHILPCLLLVSLFPQTNKTKNFVQLSAPLPNCKGVIHPDKIFILYDCSCVSRGLVQRLRPAQTPRPEVCYPTAGQKLRSFAPRWVLPSSHQGSAKKHITDDVFLAYGRANEKGAKAKIFLLCGLSSVAKKFLLSRSAFAPRWGPCPLPPQSPAPRVIQFRLFLSRVSRAHTRPWHKRAWIVYCGYVG